ncbi:MAG: hypothetical protein Q7S70_00015 [bacterium]|nr:hypothetical protein [bacterium]
MDKRTIIIIIAVILVTALAVGGYFYWSKTQGAETDNEKSALEKIDDAAKKAAESATKGVLPDIQTNPFENKPDINPANKANPYTNIKTNPF